ncbi:MAG: hypothetical protein ACO3JL_04960 [Myxococcota bacterium]
MRRNATVSHRAETGPQIAEFHFSPLEHAAFAELQEDVDIDALLERLFADTDRALSTPT